MAFIEKCKAIYGIVTNKVPPITHHISTPPTHIIHHPSGFHHVHNSHWHHSISVAIKKKVIVGFACVTVPMVIYGVTKLPHKNIEPWISPTTPFTDVPEPSGIFIFLVGLVIIFGIKYCRRIK
jgi:hypothetical protein